MAKNPFKRHRFPPEIILLAVRWYCRYPLSYRDVRDLLTERRIVVDAGTINRWVVKFGPEIAKRSFSRRGPRGLDCYVDETYVRVGGKWRYLWRAVDQNGKVIDFRLTARRDAKAVRAFFRQAQETVRIYGPMSITTDKAPTYRRILAEMNQFGFPGEEIIHVDKKWQNNRIESDHAALKRLTNPGKGFQSLRTAKATLKGIEAVRMIKRGHVYDPPSGVMREVRLLNEMFGIAA